MIETIHFKLNGKPVDLKVENERMLLWVLRTELGLTGTKYGCGIGFCGACTVLINNEAIKSCQFPIKDVAGKEVITIEGLAKNGELHPLQKAFVDHTAFCCGFCTPGMIITATALLARNPNPSRKEIVEAMDHNLCRCGSHMNIIEAIESFVREQSGGTAE